MCRRNAITAHYLVSSAALFDVIAPVPQRAANSSCSIKVLSANIRGAAIHFFAINPKTNFKRFYHRLLAVNLETVVAHLSQRPPVLSRRKSLMRVH
jgi:hypothetical protein